MGSSAFHNFRSANVHSRALKLVTTARSPRGGLPSPWKRRLVDGAPSGKPRPAVTCGSLGPESATSVTWFAVR